MLNAGRPHAARLQADWTILGEESFSFSVLEVIEDSAAVPDRELHWMQELLPVYNSSHAAPGYGNGLPRDETKSVQIKLTLSSALFERIEAVRGDRSIQEYIVEATRTAIYGSPVEQVLREHIEGLHNTLRDLLASTLSRGPAPQVVDPAEDNP